MQLTNKPQPKADQPLAETIQLFNLNIFSGSIDQVVELCREKLAQKKLLTIATPNPEQIVMAREHSDFQKTLQSFDLLIPDGQGIIWAGMIQGKKFAGRIGGRELVARLLPIIQEQKLTALVVGGEGYDEKVLSSKYKVLSRDKEGKSQSFLATTDIKVKGIELSWAKGFDKKSADHTTQVLEWIEKHHPEIIFVALGAPAQEVWIEEHRRELEQSGVRIAMIVGGAFDTLSGNVSVPPEIVQNFGFEWLWRLIQQPWRWRRQLKLLKFIEIALSTQSS